MLARDLKYFATLSRVGHMTRAAQELGITQPALSKSLRRLEDEIGAKLIDTSGRGLFLTEAGETFAGRVRIILGDIDAAVAEAGLRGGQARGNLRVGTGPIFADDYLPGAIAKLVRRDPELSFTVIADVNTKLLELLSDGELDLVFCTTFQVPQLSHLQSEDLDVNRMAVLFRKGHPLEAIDTLAPADLVEYDWVVQEEPFLTRIWLVNKLAELGLPPPRIRIETRAHRLAQALVRETDMLSFLPLQGIGQDLNARIIPGLEWDRKVGAVYRADAIQPPALRLLIDEMKRF